MTRLHHPDCRWECTTSAECEYRETRHYCPHPEHACDCAEIEADRLLGEMAPEPRATGTRLQAERVIDHEIEACLRNAAIRRTWPELVARALEREGLLRDGRE